MTEIYNNYYQYIYNFALKLTCHPEDAKDLLQDTFYKAIKNKDSLRTEQAVASWLRTICYHEFINKARREPKKYLVETCDWETLEAEGSLCMNEGIQPEEEVIVQEEIKEMQNGCFLAMVRKLTLHQRIAFSLVDMYGLSVCEVADLLEISENAAKGLLYRARMNIDAFFSDHCSIIYEKNLCSCKAWIEFSSNRENLQKNAKKLIHKLDYKEKGYQFDDEVRRKIKYLYANMPDRKPEEEWYEQILNNLQKNIE